MTPVSGKPGEPTSPPTGPGSEPRPSVPRHLPSWHPERLPDDMRAQLGPFFTTPRLGVNQAMEWAQTLVGWDQASLYSVRGHDHRPIFVAAEKGRGLLASLNRNFNPFYQNTTECLAPDGWRFLIPTGADSDRAAREAPGASGKAGPRR